MVDEERGGPALIFLLIFLSMAIPIATGAINTTAQLSRNSGVYERTLTGEYEAASGIEVALHDVLYDAAFDDGLDPGDPPVTLNALIDGVTVPVTVTKHYPLGYTYPATFTPIAAIEVTKSVFPTTTAPGTPTDYTYTISLKNTGATTIQIEAITDELPLGLTYKGPTTGIIPEDPITQMIAGRQVLRWDTSLGFSWLAQADDISIATTTGSWEDIDLSAFVPVNASGAVIELINTDASTNRAFVRGKEDTRDYTSGSQPARLSNKTHRWQIVKLDSSRVIQGWVNNTDVKFKLLGYTADSDPLYFAQPPDVSATTVGAWTSVDVSAEVDADADGVILLVYSESTQPEQYAIREVGSTYSDTSLGLARYRSTMYTVGLNPSKQFEAYISDTKIKFYLIAQTKGSMVFYADDIAVANPTLDSWQSMDADDWGVPVAAGGLIMTVEQPTKGIMTFRHGDGFDNWGPLSTNIDTATLNQAPVGLNLANRWDEYVELASSTVSIAAYVRGSAPPIAPGQTATFSFVATGTLGSGNYTNQVAGEFGVPSCRASGPTATIDVTGGTTDPGKIIGVTMAALPTLGVGFESEPYTYTMTVTNIGGGPTVVAKGHDLLPQFFDYVPGSSFMNGSPIADPTVTLDPPADPDNDQQTLDWSLSTTTLNGGDTMTLTFQATAAVDSGEYDNVGWVTTDHESFPCVSSGSSGRVTISNVLNIEADAANRGVKTRVHWWKPQGEIDIISWQE